MIHMTAEEVKSLIDSHQERMQSITDRVPAKITSQSISATVMQGESARYFIIFDTPMGLIKIKSARKDVREFASIDTAMSVVNYCGYRAATVICRGE